MTTVIKTKNSTTTTTAPSSLAQGELAVNITDKKLWVGNAAGTPVQLINGGSDGVFTSVTDSGLTAGRVVYTSTGGLLASSANLLYSGTDLTVYGITVGRGGGAIASNTVVGAGSLAANTTGSDNTALGNSNLVSNTTGIQNIAVGTAVLYPNTTGQNNAGLGFLALRLNTTGSYNTGLGNYALYSNTTASNNTAVGYQAAYSNTTGVRNTALGQVALYTNSTGQDNAAIGQGALYSNTTGSYNTAVGKDALVYNTTGQLNTAVGYRALYSQNSDAYNTAVGANTLYSNTTGTENTGFSYLALNANTTGSYNTAVGNRALQNNTTASNNTAVGYQAGYSQTTPSQGYNTHLGIQAGYTNVTGNYNTYLGGGAGYLATGSSNTFVGLSSGNAVTTGSKNTILGAYTGNQGGLDIRTASNKIVLSDGDGNIGLWIDNVSSSATTYANSPTGNRYAGFGMSINATYKAQMYWDNTNTAIYVQGASNGVYLTNTGTSWTANSDERLKDIIEPITNGAEKVASLRAVIGKYKTDEEGTRRSFLIAQDVQAVLPEAVTKNTIKDDETEYLGVAYTDVIPLLVAAIQELKAEVDSLKAQLNNGV
jgi:hypothetical protein